MSARLVYTHKTVKELKKLDRTVSQKIVKKIAMYVSADDPLTHAKKLKAPFDDLYRFRIGDYRAIFEVDGKGRVTLLRILIVGHRKHVYE